MKFHKAVKVGDRRHQGLKCNRAVLGVTASLVMLLVSARPADAAVIVDFDSFTPTAAFTGGIEDGFMIGDISGPVAVDGNYLGPLSGGNSIHHHMIGIATFSLTAVDLSSFFLESFFAGSSFGGADPLTLYGYLNGTLVGTDVFSPNPPGSYVQYSPTSLTGVFIDKLVFDMGPANLGPTHIDNVALTISVVPEPTSALGLLGLLAGGLMLRQRRSQIPPAVLVG